MGHTATKRSNIAATLTKRYVLLRHGESYANRKGLIVSAGDRALREFGLTPEGRQQVESNVRLAKLKGMLGTVELIVSSPFARALQSAEIASTLLGTSVEIDERLKERSFGDFDLTTDANYHAVWAKDAEDPTHTQWGVESVRSVFARASELVMDVDKRPTLRSVLLCTHGDVASILICGFLNEYLGRHRELGGLGVGELQELVLRTSAVTPI